jgi:hypothetical protein
VARRLFRFAGLASLYRSEPTLIVLVQAVALAIAVGCVGVYMRASGKVDWGTPLGDYFVYLAALTALAALLAPLPRIAAVLLLLAAIEMSLGIGSLVAFKFGLLKAETLCPPNGREDVRFQWHPLLQSVPQPTAAGGTTGRIHISSEGLRGPERTAEALRGKTGVALFGGSTTFDGNPDGLSWPDRLQVALGNGFAVINHGMTGYTTAEHVIQTAFYERSADLEPHCAVYFVGINDLRNAHIRNLDPAYAGLHMRPETAAGGGRPGEVFGSGG